jgi:hypothetical protein
VTKTATSESTPTSKTKVAYIKWFAEIGIEDVPLVGGKTASLGEMFRELTPNGVKVPGGFAITAAGYWHFLRETGLDQFIAAQLLDLDTNNVKQLQKCGATIRDAILAAKVPTDLRQGIWRLTISYASILKGTFPLQSEAARQRKTCLRPASPAPRKLS